MRLMSRQRQSSITFTVAPPTAAEKHVPPITTGADTTFLAPPTSAARISTETTPLVLSDTIEIEPASGAIQHVKFSPDGKYLAATSYHETPERSTTAIHVYRVERGTLYCIHKYKHSPRKYSVQLVWSFDSTILLIGLKQAVDDPPWTVYDTIGKKYDYCAPVLDDVRYVTLTPDDFGILVSYRGKRPPEFWTLEEGPAGDVDLTNQSTCAPTHPEEFEYPGLGSADQLIICAGKNDVHIWDGGTGRPIHRFQPHHQAHHESPCSTWCPVQGSPSVFATGSKDKIKLWMFMPPSDTRGDPQRSPLASLAEGPDGGEDSSHVS